MCDLNKIERPYWQWVLHFFFIYRKTHVLSYILFGNVEVIVGLDSTESRESQTSIPSNQRSQSISDVHASSRLELTHIEKRVSEPMNETNNTVRLCSGNVSYGFILQLIPLWSTFQHTLWIIA